MIKKNIAKIVGVLVFVFVAVFGPGVVSAQELHNDYQGTYRGKVLEILKEETREIPGTSTPHLFQTLSTEVLDGPKKGEVITIESDYLELDKGDKFYFNHNVYIDGQESFGIINIDRRGSLLLLVIVFVSVVIAFGKWQGVRSLVALAGSFLVIVYILLPGILNGWNPLLASSLVAGSILFLAIFFTHGFNRESLVAYAGTMIAVIFSGLFAVFAVHITDLSGFTSDETVYLNFNTGGSLNFTALLLGAFIIGFLGVLDDIAVTQAVIVSELFASNPDMKKGEVYKRAMRVGREHVGALVNTLVLAYTGASLPILLYFIMGPGSFVTTINLEIFATEIVRTIVGSIGLILTVPVVTLLAVKYLKGYKPNNSEHRHVHHHHH